MLSVQILDTPLGGSRLARGYLDGDPAATVFYGHARARPESFDSLVALLDTQWDRAAREAAVELLRGQGRVDSTRLQRFVDEGGFVVTTGQQAGYLTGPLYTITKALGAIAHAARLEAATGRPVLPVFWIASEDHDWAEAETALLLGTRGDPVRLQATPSQDPANRSVYRVPLDSPTETLSRLEELWPAGDFSEAALATVRSAYPEGANLASGFEVVLDSLVSRYGMFIVQAHDPVLKDRSQNVLGDAITGAADRATALAARGEALEAAGFHQQVTWAPGATHVLVESEQGRTRLFVDADGCRIGAEGELLSEQDVMSMMRADPSWATPDALLRPVVEATVLPVLAYVGGPGEIAYYAQNGPLYDAAQVVRPHLVGRPSLLVVEPAVSKALARIGMDASEVGGELHELRTRLARDRIPPEVHEIIAQSRLALADGIDRLKESVTQIDPTMQGPVEQAGRRGAQSLERAEKKIMQAVKRQSSEALGHLDRVRAGLFPGDVPQERSVSVFHFLGRYGPDFIEDLRRAVAAQVLE